jgi:hypothetical protein
MWEPAAIILVLVSAVMLVRLTVRYRRRRQMLAELALRLDMRFSADDCLGILDRLAGAYLTQHGHSKRVINVIQGRREQRQFLCFDYLFEVGVGQSRTVQRRTAVVWGQARALPSAVGLTGIKLEPVGRFCDFCRVRFEEQAAKTKFLVYSDAPGSAEALLSQSLCDNLDRCGDIVWEFCGNDLLLHSEKELSAFEIGSLMWRGWRCCDLLEGRTAEGQPFAGYMEREGRRKNSWKRNHVK